MQNPSKAIILYPYAFKNHSIINNLYRTLKIKRERVSQGSEVEQISNGWRDTPCQVVEIKIPEKGAIEWSIVCHYIHCIIGLIEQLRGVQNLKDYHLISVCI